MVRLFQWIDNWPVWVDYIVGGAIGVIILWQVSIEIKREIRHDHKRKYD